MPLRETTKFSLPDALAPFTTVQRVSSAEGLRDRNRPHYHPNTVEICAVTRGQLDWFVADETYVVRPGDVIVVPANVVHGAVDSNLQPGEIVAVHLAPERLAPTLTDAVASLSSRRLRQPEIGGLVRRIFEAHRSESAFRSERCAALGTLLVLAIVEFESSEQGQKDGDLIRRAQRALMGAHGNRPTVDEVADRLGVSSVWLHRLFVRETGTSPGGWARARRLSEAKRMLEEGRLSTAAIAMCLGYASGQSFATAFRRESGMTPTEFCAVHSASVAGNPKEVYRVDMRETWIDDVRIFPPEYPPEG